MPSDSFKSYPRGPKGRIVPTLAFLRQPRKTLEKWVTQYGDPFFLNAINGPIVMTGRPELIRKIFDLNSAKVDVFGFEAMRPLLGANSMLLVSGDQHRMERKLIMPMFHGERMRQYGEKMKEIAVRRIGHRRSASHFDMLDVTTEISLEVIVQTIFGGTDTSTVQMLINRSRDVLRRSLPIFIFSPKLQFSLGGFSPWDKLVKAKKDLKNALEQIIQQRRASTAAEHDSADILSLLLDATYDDGSKMNDQQIFDELGTFLFAGHETSAVAMAWAFYHLYSNPEALAKLKDELASIDIEDASALASLPYLKAVVQETLRLNPIVTDVLRITKEPTELGGYQINAGTALAAAIQLVHYNEALYPDANQFKPERFLERTFGSTEYLPFGGGHRRCAGAAFATYEMAITIGSIIKTYNLQLLEQSAVVPKRRNITMGPSTGIRFRCG